MTQSEVFSGFISLPKKQRFDLAKKIQTKLADELFNDLNDELPNIEFSEEEIMKEVYAVRYAKPKKN